MKGYFVTGTDTDCGKTYVSQILIHALRQKGLTVAPFKPVAAGAEWKNGELRNEDAELLIKAANFKGSYSSVNPYCFEPPIAPHIAAEEQDIQIELQRLSDGCLQLSKQADVVVVEGAGGWLVPLSDSESIATLAESIGLPVVLVVGMKLGCINHALLSIAAIQGAGLELAGWVANEVQWGMNRFDENLQALNARIDAPCLGVVRNGETIGSVRLSI